MTEYKIPQNHFMDWLRERIASDEIIINFQHSEHKFISEFITPNEINSWKANTPVFISAQTGQGKNWFIQNILSKELWDKRDTYENSPKMLVLSNRIALNRQNKLNFRDSILKVTGNILQANMERYYTPEGIDHYCMDFGIVTICSYHQFFEIDLNLAEYSFIVCDECHFFTSDAVFNPKTNEILKKIVKEGNDAIRIYMSATPEISFQAIVKAEYDMIQIRHQSIIDKYKSNFVQWKIKKGLYKEKKIQEFHNLAKELESLNINYYNTRRDYNYINSPIYSFFNYDDLAKTIESSPKDEKWLIFVSSLDSGDKLKDILEKKSISSNFITAKNKKSTIDDKNTFEEIIQDKKFAERVLISTAVLDNGINLCDIKLNNVAIDVFDRIEFIQMLGRIRISKEQKISLYIKNPTIKYLKTLLREKILSLMINLRIYSLPAHQNEDVFNIERILKNEFIGLKLNLKQLVFKADSYYKCNPCAIYQQIDSINEFIRIIKKDEPDFLAVELLKKYNTVPLQLYHYFRDAGKNLPWSRSIVDILENVEGQKERKAAKQNNIYHGIFEDHYDYKFGDNFLKFILGEYLPQYYNECINEKINSLKKILNYNQKNSFNNQCKYKETNIGRELLSIERLCILEDYLHSQNIINLNLQKEQSMAAQIDYYRKLADLYATPTLKFEQLLWIERLDAQVVSLPEPDVLPTSDEFLSKYIRPSEFMEKFRTSENKYDEKKLNDIAILRCEKGSNSDERQQQLWDKFCSFFNSSPPRKGSTIRIKGVTYMVKSYTGNKFNGTYYLLHQLNQEVQVSPKISDTN